MLSKCTSLKGFVRANRKVDKERRAKLCSMKPHQNNEVHNCLRKTFFVPDLWFSILGVASSTLLVIGVQRGDRSLMLPFLCFSILCVSILAPGWIFGSVFFFSLDHEYGRRFLALVGGGLALSLYSGWVVVSHYEAMRAKAKSRLEDVN